MNARRYWTAPIRLLTLAAAATLAVLALLPSAASASTGCSLGAGGRIKHVIVLQFDNVHLRRDIPNVPSDIEQIPALYHFMVDNGTLLSNDHTVLISHTADGIVSTETGLYPDHFGLGVANTFPYLDPTQTKFQAGGSATDVPGTNDQSAFTYWTDPVSSSDPLYELIHAAASPANPDGVNTPAPWVSFTRAGCDFGAFGAANMELESDTGDVANVFGSSSPQAALGNWSYNTAYGQNFAAGSNLGTADFEGLAIHCSQADSTAAGPCSPTNGGRADLLPDEPGGYHGFNALFGALGVNPVLTGRPDRSLPASYTPVGDTPPPGGNWLAPPVHDVFSPNANNTGPGAVPVQVRLSNVTPPPSSYNPGHTPTTPVLDSTGNPGFPGFDGMEANNALGYTAAAQEAGIPVTYTYLSDVHDDEYNYIGGNSFGPGEAGHEAQLHQYNAAFTAFFHRLKADGITKANTMFLITVDEGDHFAGGPPLNPGCNGVTVLCQYGSGAARNVGEVDVNLPGLLKGTTGNSTLFGFDNDDAPAIIVPNQTSPSGPRPGPYSAVVRNLERQLGGLREYDPINGRTVPITRAMSDPFEESILHMLNADPRRVPSFTLFGNPDFYFQGHCDQSTSTHGPGCPSQYPGDAWNHGDVQPVIANTWAGWVGPGVRHLGRTGAVWTDHTDARATLLTLLGLRDDYQWDGRAITQLMSAPPLTGSPLGLFEQLGAAYKQLDAPFGEFGYDTLRADTRALRSGPGDAWRYAAVTEQLRTCQTQRDQLVAAIQPELEAVETGSGSFNSEQARAQLEQAQELIGDARELAGSSSPQRAHTCG